MEVKKPSLVFVVSCVLVTLVFVSDVMKKNSSFQDFWNSEELNFVPDEFDVMKANCNCEISKSFLYNSAISKKIRNYFQARGENRTQYIWTPFNQTSCGLKSYLRGSGQKVIAYSFFTFPNFNISKAQFYLNGIQGNLETFPKFFPDFKMRLYFDLNSSDPLFKDICQIACNNQDKLDLCYVRKLPGVPMKDARKIFPRNWRFFPALDSQVSLMLSRDLDSRISEREYSAVQEWLNSSKVFHVMRDHPAHGTSILAGTWGIKLNEMAGYGRTMFRKSFTAAASDPVMWSDKRVGDADQTFLTRYIWKWAKKVSMSHDSYTCKRFSYTKAFPTQRINKTDNFVAAILGENKTLWEPCPYKCRPKDHKDWTYC